MNNKNAPDTAKKKDKGSADHLKSKEKSTLIARAFQLSLPVFCGYLFLGSAFGIMFSALGFSPLWAGATSVLVYAGSGQFALTSMIGAGASYITVFLTSFFVNSRHIFYGLTFIEEYKSMGLKGKYMIFALTDETYSVHCFMKNACEDIRVWFYVSLFDHLYWILGGMLGALIGGLSSFDFEGIEFSMTALFAVILVDRIRTIGKEAVITALMGGISALGLLFLLGESNFLLPSMGISLLLVYIKGTHSHAKEAKAVSQGTATTADHPLSEAKEEQTK